MTKVHFFLEVLDLFYRVALRGDNSGKEGLRTLAVLYGLPHRR